MKSRQVAGTLTVLALLALVCVAPVSAAEPNGRGLELVTPRGPGPTVTNVAAISPDGEAIAYTSFGPYPDAIAGDVVSYNRASRSAEGWLSAPIGPAYEVTETIFRPTEPVGFDPGLKTSLWRASLPLTPEGPPAGRFGFYRRASDGSISLLAVLGKANPEVAGVSREADHLVFDSIEHLLPSDGTRIEGSGVYELVGASMREVDVGADGRELDPCGAEAGGPNAVSESGDRVVFTAPASTCSEPRRVYIREGGERTVEASASHCTRADCNAPKDVYFAGATPDGSSVFMVTAQQLTDADEDAGADLYRYDATDGDLFLLTPGTSGEVLAEPVHAAAVGTRVYLYARGRLLPGLGSPTSTNLYLWQEGQLRFVAVLGAERPLQISADGRYAVFATPTSLSAGKERERPLLFSFDGSDSIAGRFGAITRIGIDETTGSVYVLDTSHDVVDKFTADGAAAPFASLGTSSLSGATTPAGSFGLNDEADISVDNSRTASQGRIYVNAEHGPVIALAPEGNYLWQLPAHLFGDNCGTAVDAQGHLWVADWQKGRALEFGADGSPPEQTGAIDSTTGNPCRLNFDREGNLYLSIWNSKVDRYEGGAFASNLDPESSQDVAIDQSSDDGLLFAVHEKGFSEFTSGGQRLGSFGEGVVERGVGIAYNPGRDWVYVADAGARTIDVFGPPAFRPATDLPVEGDDEDDVADVYRYDAVAKRFQLLSIGDAGGNGPLAATIRSPLEEPEFFELPIHLQALSSDGDRAWFATSERLLSEDRNDFEDVYEWDAGHLYLVSSGPGSSPAQFAGATADGRTVLLRTARTLLPADRDGGESDLYAARLGGGFAESAAAPECSQQPCRREPAGTTRFVAPVTAADRQRRGGPLRITHLSKDLIAAILGRGSTSVTVQVPGAGLVSATALTGGTLLGHGVAGATHRGRVRIRLQWNARAHMLVGSGATLSLRLLVAEGAATAKRDITLRGRRAG